MYLSPIYNSFWLHKPNKGSIYVPFPLSSPGIRKIIAFSLYIQIVTQRFCPDSGSFEPSLYQLG